MTAPSRPSASSPPRSPISAGVHLGSPLAMASRCRRRRRARPRERHRVRSSPGRSRPGGDVPGDDNGHVRARLFRISPSSVRRVERLASSPPLARARAPLRGWRRRTRERHQRHDHRFEPEPRPVSPDVIADAFVSPPAAASSARSRGAATMPRRPETPSTRSYAPVASRADELVATVLARRAPRPTATGPTTATETTTAPRAQKTETTSSSARRIWSAVPSSTSARTLFPRPRAFADAHPPPARPSSNAIGPAARTGA